MNNTSFKRTFKEKKSDEPRADLQKVFEKVLENFCYVGKSVEFTKEILSECCNKLEDLRSQMEVLGSVIQETTANNQNPHPDARESVQGRNRLKNSSDQEIIEEITIEGGEKSVYSSPENRRKRPRTNTIDEEISIITQQADDKCTPGPSGEPSKSTKCSHSKSQNVISGKNLTDSSGTVCDENVVEAALQKTKGVLSTQELSAFIQLSGNVDDPVQLAKVSFTNDIKMLYFQLMTFHFHLKVANDVTEDAKGVHATNRDLECKVQRLIHAFQENF